MQRSRVLCLMAILCVAPSTSLQINQTTQMLSNERSNGGNLCISVAAYEDPEWIHLVIKNVQRFTEPSTKLALHLNSNTEYTDEFIASLETSRVTVAPERVFVGRFKGVSMYANALNFKAMEARWPGYCDYAMMSMSNQLFVRSGIEQVVRKYQYGPIGARTSAHQESLYDSGLYQQLLAPRNFHASGTNEGAFFPMSTINGFLRLFDGWLATKPDLDKLVFNNNWCYFESTWLQTYVLNHDGCKDISCNAERCHADCGFSPPTCFVVIGSIATGYVSLDDVRLIARGEKQHGQYYSVKRVRRDMRDRVVGEIRNMVSDSEMFEDQLVEALEDRAWLAEAENIIAEESI